MNMREPWRSRFIQLVRDGAASRDIHDSSGCGSYDSEQTGAASERFVERELERVRLHAGSLCAPLVRRIGSAQRILDVGCGTGGTTVALALSELGAQRLVGMDASAPVLEAARARALAHDLDRARVEFVHVPAGASLPFNDASFDLVTCVSVLEFVSTAAGRRMLLAEMLRVLRPGGHLYLATPSPLRLREYHSRRWLGDYRRSAGYPWSSASGALRTMLPGCRVESLAQDRIRAHPRLRRLGWAAPVLATALPWQRLLACKSG